MMEIKISSAVNAQSVNNYSVEKAAVSSGTKSAVSESEDRAVTARNYSVTPVDEKRPENNQAGNASSRNGKEPTEKQVKSTIDLANHELKHAKTGLDFKYHEATKRVSITVYDKETKEVIREIPPEKSLDMLEKMWELAGMVVDDRR